MVEKGIFQVSPSLQGFGSTGQASSAGLFAMTFDGLPHCTFFCQTKAPRRRGQCLVCSFPPSLSVILCYLLGACYVTELYILIATRFGVDRQPEEQMTKNFYIQALFLWFDEIPNSLGGDKNF